MPEQKEKRRNLGRWTLGLLVAHGARGETPVTLQNYHLTWVDVFKQQTELPIVLNGTEHGFHYDGHGAISAGATSRLLHDYAEPHRSRILDLLFKPQIGAALHQLKVEIGGDSQSLVGTEPSHMHRQGDLSCNRGYELWLIREARLRNPKIVIYALPWSVPYWVGFHDFYPRGFYYGQYNIEYRINWLKCVRQLNVGDVDFLGHWNERSWGSPQWTVHLRNSLDANGFQNTRLVIPDGDYDDSILSNMSNAAFGAAMQGGGIGVHFPCFLERPQIYAFGLKYLSSEDWFSSNNWTGAACLGRILNQNFVRMNVTATLARSMLRSTYPLLPHREKALLSAAEPWSGHYVVHAPVWTIAHTTHFTEVGWKILSTNGGQQTGSSGYLRKGGSYVTYVSPIKDKFTLVVEKLHGDCDRCTGQTTGEENLTFCLVGGLEHVPSRRVSFWSSNRTHQFVHLNDLSLYEMSLTQHLVVYDKKVCFTFVARPDTMYTVSTALMVHSINASGVLNASNVISPDTVFTTVSEEIDAFLNDTMAEAANVSSNGTNSSLHLASTTIHPSMDWSSTSLNVSNTSHALHVQFALQLQLSDDMSSVPSNATNQTQAFAVAMDSIPDSAPFPTYHTDEFEAYAIDTNPHYFTDFAGSWQIAEDPTRLGNKVFKQWVIQQSGVNEWVADSEPLTLIGDDLVNVVVSVDMYLPPYQAPYAGIEPAHVNIQSVWNGLCFGAENQGTWSGVAVQGVPCAPYWHQQFTYNANGGTLRLPRTRKCLSASGCPGALGDPERSVLCFQDCCDASTICTGQSWHWDADKTIRLANQPSSQPSMCITATGQAAASAGANFSFAAAFGHKLYLTQCEQASTRQQWIPTATSYARYAGICARLSPPLFGIQERHLGRSGYCLNLGVDERGNAFWQLEKEGAVVLARDIPDVGTGYWHSLVLQTYNRQVTAAVDGWPPVTINDESYRTGMVALNCGWGEAYFDNFTIGEADPDLVSV